MGYSVNVLSGDGSLLPSIHADVRYFDDVTAIEGHVIIRNKLRAAYMWMDGYAKVANNVMGGLPNGT